MPLVTEDAGTEEAEADAEYDNALKEAIRGVQDAVTSINEHIEKYLVNGLTLTIPQYSNVTKVRYKQKDGSTLIAFANFVSKDGRGETPTSRIH
ncbi:hypothetical protein Tsubulata_019850 [Turnera subulata]|uniref:Uncharacterized protein n=1 Tax=Turnera subulata TaxID=218843 RepID=A0A9Q0IYF0_9ROSI|nr:hypothetical protein Tsubulata_019850 [Turnera subulata]